MLGQHYGPFRATALWNEAVCMFRDGMLLSEHRHWLHKHKDSFTGRDAVTFIRSALQNNDLFNPNVTREQACQLLNQFLNANFIVPVANCSNTTGRKLLDSHKHFYEFTETLLNFEPSLPFSAVRNCKIEGSSALQPDNNSCGSFKPDNLEHIWKDTLMARLKKLLHPLDIENLLFSKDIDSKWIIANVSPEYAKLKWNTELPHWVLGAINNLLEWCSKNNQIITYTNFETDVFKVIHEYFYTLQAPLISFCLFDLFVNVFLYLQYLNNLEKGKVLKKEMSESRENLVLDISSPIRTLKVRNEDILKSTHDHKIPLPPGSCFETAFTSDQPVTRIVPKCSIDTIHLRNANKSCNPVMKAVEGNKCSNTLLIDDKENIFYRKINENSTSPISQLQQINKKTFVEKFSIHSQLDTFQSRPLRSTENIDRPTRKKNQPKTLFKKNSVRQCPSHGLVNHGFSQFSPSEKKLDGCEKMKRHLGFEKSSKQKQKLNSKSQKNDEINYESRNGLSYISELDSDYDFDYQFALESVKKLMHASLPRGKQRYSSSDDDDDSSSYYTAASTSSSSSCASPSPSSTHFRDFDPLYDWSDNLLELGISVYKLLLLLLPPCNRAQLMYLILLMKHVPVVSKSPYLTQQNMVAKLTKSIMRPEYGTNFDVSLIRRIITFLINHFEALFFDIPSDLYDSISHQISFRNKHRTFWEPISTQQFKDKKPYGVRIS